MSSGGIQAKGSGGRLSVGGRAAADLGAWDFSYGPEGWRLRAALRSHDPYWLDQGGPWRLRVLPSERSSWTWQGDAVRDVAWTDTDITITGEGEPQHG